MARKCCCCYMAVTADKYELPIAVFNNIHEAVKWTGYEAVTIRAKASRHTFDTKYKCIFVSVKDYDNEDELFM